MTWESSKGFSKFNSQGGEIGDEKLHETYLHDVSHELSPAKIISYVFVNFPKFHRKEYKIGDKNVIINAKAKILRLYIYLY